MINSKLGILIDNLNDLREQKRSAQDEIKDIQSKYDDLERQVIEIMDANGLEKAAGDLATASYKIETYPQVDDKEKLTRWCVENNKFEFLQSRVNAGPVKEMLDAENLLPEGVTVFTKAKLGLRRK